MDVTWVSMTWLHQVSIVVLLGFYTALAIVVLPAVSRSLDGDGVGRAVGAIGRRSRPLVIVTVLVFLVTGTYLLLTAGRYDGVGNVFASTWTTLLTVKHLLVLVMLAVAFAVDRLAVAVSEAGSDTARETALGALGLATQGVTVIGLLVLLLTASAQGS